jgi:hypothetical protein
MDELGEHRDLYGSARQNVIPYIHREDVLYCYVFAQVWVVLVPKSLRILTSARPFIAQGYDSYIAIQGPTGGPGVIESLRDRALLARSSK